MQIEIQNTRLESFLYRAEQVRELDRIAIQEFGIAGATLMKRAGTAAFAALREQWPQAQRIAVVCGVGNNGGDGYVVAHLAHAAGMKVEAMQIGAVDQLKGDALAAARAFRANGGETRNFEARLLPQADVVVDALLGTGLQRPVAGVWRDAIDAINAAGVPVLAIDLPSGLHADTGMALGAVVHAALTVSFIALKQGMFTGAGPDHCGRILLDDLQTPPEIYARIAPVATRMHPDCLRIALPARARGAHKGDFGHVLVVGGAPGMSGAARLAAEAAARVGAGLVSVATHPAHATVLNAGRPEIMCRGVERGEDLESLLERATAVAIGPGLGRSDWARGLFEHVLHSALPLVVDADALNLLAQAPQARGNWVLTPHPGEAARLLGIDSPTVQSDRFAAVYELVRRFEGVVVLKGAGTLVAHAAAPVALCHAGNPGMASGGTGDVLTGVIAGLLAQGLPLPEAAQAGVYFHALAGDAAAMEGERGLLAGDLMPHLRRLVN